jgi:hypothetical protein
MIKKLLCGMIFTALCATGCASTHVQHMAQLSPPVKEMPAEARHITWRPFAKGTAQLAMRQKKITLLFFYDDTAPSTEMRKNVLTDKCVIDQIEDHFIFVGINVDETPGALDALLDKGVIPPVVLYVIPGEGIAPISTKNLPAKTYCKILTELSSKVHIK